MLSIDESAWWTITDVRDAVSRRRVGLEACLVRVTALADLPGWEGAASDEARDAVFRLRAAIDTLISESNTAADCLDDLLAVDSVAGDDRSIARRLDAIGIDRLLSISHETNPPSEAPSFYRDLDRRNRQRLDGERRRLSDEAVALRAELDSNVFGGIFSNADAGLAQTDRRLRALDQIVAVLARGDRQLLAFDNSVGERTLAAIAVGDVDIARHVAVFVPGLNSSVDTDIGRYDADMSSLREATEASLRVHSSQGYPQTGTSSSSVSAVTWLDYDVPQVKWKLGLSELEVLNVGPAIRGADRLDQFLADLEAHTASDSNITLLGHSYGSLTAAEAVRGAPGSGRVDDLVVFGSPGLGIADVNDLSMDTGHVFVAESVSDPVSDAAIFGFDPNQLHGVVNISAEAVTDADGSKFTASHGHSQYLSPGTTSQHNIALITAGFRNEVLTGDDRGWRDHLQTPVR